MSGWQKMCLSDLCSLITDGKHGDCRDENGSGYYFLSVKDVLGGRLVYDNARQIAKSDFLETHQRTNLSPGDILFTNTGTIGRMAIAADDPKTYRTTFQKSVAILKPKRKIILPRLFYYLLQFDNARLSEFAAGTTQKNLLLKDFRTFTVHVPSLSEQHAIAAMLGALDDKIELNRRMNETLEALARALFQNWFVDATQAGLPKGWREAPFTEIVDILGGGTPKTSVSEYWGGDIPWFSVVDAPQDSDVFVIDTEKRITRAGVENSSTQVLPVGTTIISARGTVGKVALVGVPMAMNQSCYGLRGKAGKKGFHAYFATRALVSTLQQHAHGSVFDTITRDTLTSMIVALPPAAVVEQFEETVSPLMERIRNNLFESRTLAALRDALLPKLLSGELRVPAAAKLVEARA